jgi:hypothetical protein
VLAENVLLLRQVPIDGELHRVLAVLNMRFSEFDRHFHEFTLTDEGFRPCVILLARARWMPVWTW